MGAEESDYQHACLILYARNQSLIVALDVEHDYGEMSREKGVDIIVR